MGTFFSFSKRSKARASEGRRLGVSSDHSRSTTKVALVFWRDPKDGEFVEDEHWPMIFFNGAHYQGNLGKAGIIDTPWVRDLVFTLYPSSPPGIIGGAVDPPTMQLQSYCRDQHYKVKFTTSSHPKRSDLVLAEVSSQ